MFEAIRDCEGTDGWYCLHSVGIARHERKRYAECDFVLITDSGVFCLEVKGGDTCTVKPLIFAFRDTARGNYGMLPEK